LAQPVAVGPGDGAAEQCVFNISDAGFAFPSAGAGVGVAVLLDDVAEAIANVVRGVVIGIGDRRDGASIPMRICPSLTPKIVTTTSSPIISEAPRWQVKISIIDSFQINPIKDALMRAIDECEALAN